MTILGSLSGLASSAKDTALGAAGAVKDAAKGAAETTAAYAKAKELELRTFAEKQALLGYFIPESYVTWYQTERTALGFEPPSTFLLPVLLVAIPMTLGILMREAFNRGSRMISITTKVATGEKTTQGQAIFFILGCLVIFAIALIVLFFWKGPGLTAVKDLRAVQSSIGTKVGFQNPQTVARSAYMLVNIQPLSVKQAGYIGPAEKDGKFDPVGTIQSNITSGVKFFTLQIDYLEREKDEKNFEKINVPTLLYRDSVGNLISLNGGKINDIATQLKIYAFSPDLQSSNQAIIVYLHFVRVPADPLKNPAEYLKFMKEVSKALTPIHPNILKTTPGGNFTRQRAEDTLLKLPLSDIQNKIILMSNADTTIFRNSAATGGAIDASLDLDSFISMRVYAYKSVDRIGLTQTTDINPKAILINYGCLKGMSSSDKAAFAMKGKNRFVIAMPGPLENPTYDDMKSLLTDTGVNAIPLNLIGTDSKTIDKLIVDWSAAKPYYLVKPMMLQSYTTTVSPND